MSVFTTGVKETPAAPEWRHEFLMLADTDYNEAWAHDHASELRDRAAEPDVMRIVERGRRLHHYRETDLGIVDRSLLRHCLREKREGETYPPDVVGKDAPPPV